MADSGVTSDAVLLGRHNHENNFPSRYLLGVIHGGFGARDITG
jgi:hypothetical protein